MTSVFLSLILGVGALGLFFNVCMLRLKISNQTLRPFVICQFIFQFTILCVNTMDALNSWWPYYAQHDQWAEVVGPRVLKLSMAALLAFNILAVAAFLQSFHDPRWKHCYNIGVKLLVTSSIALGCLDFTVVWLQSHNFVPQAAIFVIMVLYFLLLFLALALTKAIDWNQSKRKIEQISLCAIYQRTLLFFGIWLILNWVFVFLHFAIPHLSRVVLGGKDEFLLMSFMVNVSTGLILPSGFIFVFNSKTDEHDKKKSIVLIV